MRDICCSPDGRWIALGFSSGLASVLDVRGGLLRSHRRAHTSEIYQVQAFLKLVVYRKALLRSTSCVAIFLRLLLDGSYTGKRFYETFPSTNSKTRYDNFVATMRVAFRKEYLDSTVCNTFCNLSPHFLLAVYRCATLGNISFNLYHRGVSRQVDKLHK